LPRLFTIMRKIEQDILNTLRDDCYMTRKVIMKRTGRSKTPVYDAISALMDADLIDEARVVTIDSNRIETAYMKII
jgi:DNA-binding Lrp family transcriptional regulator